MNPEWAYIILAPIGAMLFAIGGTGFKWARRYVMPVVLCGGWWLGRLLLHSDTTLIWQAPLACALMIVVMHLGYGDGKGWIWRAFVAFSYTASTVPLGFSWWQVITPVVFIGLFWLSNWKYTANIIVWKCVELSCGGLLGITIGSLV